MKEIPVNIQLPAGEEDVCGGLIQYPMAILAMIQLLVINLYLASDIIFFFYNYIFMPALNEDWWSNLMSWLFYLSLAILLYKGIQSCMRPAERKKRNSPDQPAIIQEKSDGLEFYIMAFATTGYFAFVHQWSFSSPSLMDQL